MRFCIDGTAHQVESVLDQWYEPDSAMYKVRADDGNIYILRQNTSTPDGTWELVAVRSA